MQSIHKSVKGLLQWKYDSSVKKKLLKTQNRTQDKQSKSEEDSAERQISGWISKIGGIAHYHIADRSTESNGTETLSSCSLDHKPHYPLLQFNSLKSDTAHAAGQIIAPDHSSSLQAGSGISSVCHADAPQCHRSAHSAPLNSSDQTLRHSHSIFFVVTVNEACWNSKQAPFYKHQYFNQAHLCTYWLIHSPLETMGRLPLTSHQAHKKWGR